MVHSLIQHEAPVFTEEGQLAYTTVFDLTTVQKHLGCLLQT